MNKIETYLLSLGGHVSNRGFGYIAEAVEMVMDNEEILHQITTHIYPAVGEKHGSTPKSVERCIRSEIGRIYSENHGLPPEFAAKSGKSLTNREFLARMARVMQP